MKALVLGAGGQLGKEFVRYFSQSGVPYVAFDHAGCDITSGSSIKTVFDAARPDLVINASAYNQVDRAEDDPAGAFAVNSEGPQLIAGLAAGRGAQCIHFSTDYVFDGAKGAPYVESDRPLPLSVYAKSKLAGEEAVLKASSRHLVFRVSWVIGAGKQNFLFKARQWAASGEVIKIADDEVSVPTFTPTIVTAVDKAVKSGLTGLHHLCSSGQASRYEMVTAYFEAAGIRCKAVVPVSMTSFGLKARRPGYSAMSNARLSRALDINIPDWRDDLQKYMGMLPPQDIPI